MSINGFLGLRIYIGLGDEILGYGSKDSLSPLDCKASLGLMDDS